MADWLDRLFDSLKKDERTWKRRWLHRRHRLSGEVVAWLNEPARTLAEREMFAELLLRLDADPVGASEPVLREGVARGMRWAGFGAHRAILVWDQAQNTIRLVLCV